ncbi:MAG: enoyl-CoA hydratase, partial [Deltaproteobacteria bacterium]|nr:enoyl-CoA hydratase [Deltaproteobacteria bacterium]
ALEEAEQNNDIRVIIITGAGKALSSGMDLNDDSGATTAHDSKKLTPEQEALQKMTTLQYAFTMKKPVIVAINGAAVGMGITTFLPFDIRIASESARIGFVFTRRGIVPEIGSPWLLPRIIGLSKAAELLYSGRIINAQEALECGLVSRVVPDTQLMTEARKLAEEIAGSSPTGVALTKSMILQFLFET